MSPPGVTRRREIGVLVEEYQDYNDMPFELARMLIEHGRGAQWRIELKDDPPILSTEQFTALILSAEYLLCRKGIRDFRQFALALGRMMGHQVLRYAAMAYYGVLLQPGVGNSGMSPPKNIDQVMASLVPNQ